MAKPKFDPKGRSDAMKSGKGDKPGKGKAPPFAGKAAKKGAARGR